MPNQARMTQTATDAAVPKDGALDPSSWAVHWGRGRKGQALALVQAFGDLVLLACGVVVAYLMIYSWPSVPGGAPATIPAMFPALLRTVRAPEFAPYFPLLLIVPVLRLLVFEWVDLYQTSLCDTRPFHGAGKMLKGVLLGSALMFLFFSGYRTVQPDQAQPMVSLFLAYEGLLAFFIVLLYHSSVLMGVLVLHAFGLWRTRVAVVHDGTPPDGLLQALRSPATEYQYIGEIAAREGADAGTAVLGGLGELKTLINRHQLDEVILALDPAGMPPEQRLGVAQTCWRMGAQIKMCTPFQPFFRTSALPELVGDVPLLRVENLGLYATAPQVAKRLMDIVVSAAGLLVISPILLVLGILIKLDSPGPMFFIQERVGLNGRTFRMIKFRSMRANSDPAIHKQFLEQMIQAEGGHHELDAAGKPVYKIVNDPRITRMGKFIRKTSLDELPQLFNVLRGDMSLVGPRPPIQYEVDAYKDWHMKRLYIRPGITGLWQVSGRNRLSFDQMVQLDIAYIEQWNLWTDIKILVRTIPVVLHLDQAF